MCSRYWAEKWRVIPEMFYVYQHIYYPHLGSSTPNPPIFFRLEKMSTTTGLLIWDEKNTMPKPNNTATSKSSVWRQVLAQWLQTGPILHGLILLCEGSQLGCPQSTGLKSSLEHTCQWRASWKTTVPTKPALASPSLAEAWPTRCHQADWQLCVYCQTLVYPSAEGNPGREAWHAWVDTMWYSAWSSWGAATTEQRP